ncbi:MAG: SRPBCC domain-containing protein [Defluviitaleaceae bacterium]|nr:SRPBCC domain-containing protein [Defluviitaleaceae bacterium]
MSSIRLEKTYPVPKDAVWAYLIKDELLTSWCMPTKGFVLEKGQGFVFNIPPNIFFSGTFHNTVIDFEDGALLSYKCTATKPKLDTIVKWTLIEKNSTTQLALEHSGFKSTQWLTKIMLKSGWKKMMYSHLYETLVKS